MDSQEILTFLRRTEPFDKLPSDDLKKVLSQVTEHKFSRKEVLYIQHKSEILGLDIICSGNYETFFYDTEGRKTFSSELGRHTTYGIFSILFNENISIHSVEAKKKTGVLRIPSELFRSFYEKYDAIQQFVSSTFGKMMLNRQYAYYVMSRDKGQDAIVFDKLFSQRLTTVSLRPIITCEMDLPVFEAARLMEESRTSCLFVTQNEIIKGYITDIVLRNKVVGALADVHNQAHTIMDEQVYAISQTAYVYEAALLMFSRSIRYLLVEADGENIGLISRYDLLRDKMQSPFIFIQTLRMSNTPGELETKWKEVPEIVNNMIINGVRTEIVNKVITNITESILQRVFYWSENELADAPAPYAIMSFGAFAREEMTLKPAFKCAIVFEDTSKSHARNSHKYFLMLVEKIVEKLRMVGLNNAIGDFTDQTPIEVHSASEWTKMYTQRISGENRQISATCFDIRYFYGEKDLIETIKRKVGRKLSKTDGIFDQLSEEALKIDLPLTFFKTIKTQTLGDSEVFDVMNALQSVTDFVRILSLRHGGVSIVNTGERLEFLHQNGLLSSRHYNEMMQSFYYLMGMRIKYQARNMLFENKPATDLIDLRRLTTIEQITLKEIFNLIHEIRQSLKVSPWKMLTLPIEKLSGKKI